MGCDLLRRHKAFVHRPDEQLRGDNRKPFAEVISIFVAIAVGTFIHPIAIPRRRVRPVLQDRQHFLDSANTSPPLRQPWHGEVRFTWSHRPLDAFRELLSMIRGNTPDDMNIAMPVGVDGLMSSTRGM